MIAYKYKLYQTKRTKHLDAMLREASFVWNHALALRRGSMSNVNSLSRRFFLDDAQEIRLVRCGQVNAALFGRPCPEPLDGRRQLSRIAVPRTADCLDIAQERVAFYAAKYLAVAELFEILLFHVFHRLAILDGKPPQNQMQIAVLTERALGLSLGKLHNAAPFIEGIAPALETLAVEFCSEIVKHTQKGSPSGSSS